MTHYEAVVLAPGKAELYVDGVRIGDVTEVSVTVVHDEVSIHNLPPGESITLGVTYLHDGEEVFASGDCIFDFANYLEPAPVVAEPRRKQAQWKSERRGRGRR